MAKGLRSKTKKRLRSARRQHLYSVKGKQELETVANKLHDPSYDLRADYELPPNAYIDPTVPGSVFPQIAKPDIVAFRSHKMELGGWTAVHNFRKIDNPNAKKSKFEHIVKSAEDIVRESKEGEEKKVVAMEEDSADDEGSIDLNELAKNSKMTVEDLNFEALKIGKRKGAHTITKTTLTKKEKVGKHKVLRKDGQLRRKKKANLRKPLKKFWINV